MKSDSNKSRKDFQGGSNRSRSGLRAQHRRQRVGGLAAGAGGNHVVNGLIQLVSGSLDALQVVANRSRNSLLDGSKVLVA